MSDMADVAGKVECESHHWVSTNVPGLVARWVIQCSLCGAYNVDEMNATLTAAGFGLVQAAHAEALLGAADALEMQPPKLRGQYVYTLRLYAAEPWRLNREASS